MTSEPQVALAGRPQDVTANGLRHRVLDYAPADGADHRGDVVMLCGITSPAATADFLARPIAARGFRVVVPDIRGRGDSDVPPAGSYRMTDYAADVAGLVAALDLKAPALVGHSMGARIAAAYAVRHAPAAHGLLVLVDPPVCGPGRAPYPTSWASFQAQLHEAKAGTTVDAVRRFYPKWPERELRLRIQVLPTCDETAVLESYEGFHSEDFFEHWRRLTGPAVLIRGAESPVVPESAAAELAVENPEIPLVAVPGAGHMVPWDNFDGFMSVLLPRLEAAGGPPRA